MSLKVGNPTGTVAVPPAVEKKKTPADLKTAAKKTPIQPGELTQPRSIKKAEPVGLLPDAAVNEAGPKSSPIALVNPTNDPATAAALLKSPQAWDIGEWNQAVSAGAKSPQIATQYAKLFKRQTEYQKAYRAAVAATQQGGAAGQDKAANVIPSRIVYNALQADSNPSSSVNTPVYLGQVRHPTTEQVASVAAQIRFIGTQSPLAAKQLLNFLPETLRPLIDKAAAAIPYQPGAPFSTDRAIGSIVADPNVVKAAASWNAAFADHPNFLERNNQAALVRYNAAEKNQTQTANGLLWAQNGVKQATATGSFGGTTLASWKERLTNETLWAGNAAGSKTLVANATEQALTTTTHSKAEVYFASAAAANPGVQPTLPTAAALARFPNIGAVQFKSLPQASLWGDGTTKVSAGAKSILFSGSRNQKLVGLGAAVNQGLHSGDCVLDATLAALAAKNPTALKNMIRPAGDGDPHHYTVNFYAKNAATGKMGPTSVRVDDTLPLGQNGQTVGDAVTYDSKNKPIIGVALIQKAFAKLNDIHPISQRASAATGYVGAQGLDPALMMQAITGTASPTTLKTASTSEAALLKLLQRSNPPSNHPVTASTGGSQTGLDTSTGVVMGHDYTVLQTQTTGAKTSVTLRNPWGAREQFNPNGRADGVISLSLADFKKIFSAVTA